MKNYNFKKAFTLAEVLATVIILGIIASITIPSTLHRVTERQNKTRVRKALTTYQTAIEKMIIENSLPRTNEALNQWANNDGNCTNARRYLKGTRDGATACIFRSADGLWYNITDISNTLIGFDDHGRPTNVTDGGNLALGDENKAFAFVTSFDSNASIRVQDNTYEENNGDSDTAWATEKVQCYLDNGQCPHTSSVCTCTTENCCTNRCSNKQCKETTKNCTNMWAGRSPYNYYGSPRYTNTCQKNKYFAEDNSYSFLIEEYDNGNGMFTDNIDTLTGMQYPTFYKVNGSGDSATITFAINCGGDSICDAQFNRKGELVKAHTPHRGNCNSAEECKTKFAGCTMQLCTYNTNTNEWENPDQESNYAKATIAILENFKNNGNVHFSQ